MKVIKSRSFRLETMNGLPVYRNEKGYTAEPQPDEEYIIPTLILSLPLRADAKEKLDAFREYAAVMMGEPLKVVQAKLRIL